MRSILLTGGLAMTLWGCGNIEPVPPSDEPITDPAQLYMALTLDYPAVNLSTAAPYNTLRLTATPRDALGIPMTGLPVPVYESSDTTKVTVTADGLLTAVEPAGGVRVFARLTAGPVTHTDTAVVNVTSLATPPMLEVLSIHPVPPDSAKWAVPIPGTNPFHSANQIVGNVGYLDPTYAGFVPLIEGFLSLTPQVMDAADVAIPGLQLEFTALDPTIATIDRRSGAVHVLHPGSARMVVQTNAYGVFKADTATYTVTPPVLEQTTAQAGTGGLPVFDPEEIRIAPYGLVGWFNTFQDSVDVVFDDPTNVIAPPSGICDALPGIVGFPGSFCGAGNILLPVGPVLPPFLPPGFSALLTMQLRQFPVPGVYPYRSSRTGATGKIIVTNDPYAD